MDFYDFNKLFKSFIIYYIFIFSHFSNLKIKIDSNKINYLTQNIKKKILY